MVSLVTGLLFWASPSVILMLDRSFGCVFEEVLSSLLILGGLMSLN